MILLFTGVALVAGGPPSAHSGVGLEAVLILLPFATMLLSFFVFLAMQYVFTRAMNLETVQVKQALTRGLSTSFSAFLTLLITSVLVWLGLLLFVLPGVYIGIRLLYALPIVVNEKISSFAAIKRSFTLTKNSMWELLGTGSLLTLVALLTYAEDFLSVWTDNMGILFTVYVATVILSIVLQFIAISAVTFRYHQSDLVDKKLLRQSTTATSNFVLPIVVVVLVILLPVAAVFQAISSPSTTTTQQDIPRIEDLLERDQNSRSDILFN